MSKYTVILGDTFENIARKEYGTELEIDKIIKANPGVFEPLTPGIVLNIPTLPDAPQNLQQQSLADNISEVAILIDDERFRFWNNITITRSIDSIDTVEFEAPFDADNLIFRKIFKPFSYKTVVITVNGLPLFTGTIIGINPILENDQKIITVNAYSLPGVLNDCTSPASSLSLESKNQGIREIAVTMSSPFGIGVEFNADQGAIFEQVSSVSEKRVLSYLIELAKQRNLIISSTELGKLLFQQSAEIGNPIAILRQGNTPLLSVIPFFNPQEYYSHITGLEPTDIGIQGSQFTVKNPLLEGVIRPLSFIPQDTSKADVKTATEAKMGRMFGNMVSYNIHLNSWYDSFNNLWKPNTTIKLKAPDAMIYNEFEFTIRSIEFNRNSKAEIAILNLVIPGSFNGQIPEVLPWDE
jgi:prophage tail gpP-like protein